MIARSTFRAVYEQYSERDGERFTVLRELTNEECDEEVGPMYHIRFEDGTEIDAWPEEIDAEVDVFLGKPWWEVCD